ncbi:MAG: DUF502 domain-containing protein [Hyphomicrobium sp.]
MRVFLAGLLAALPLLVTILVTAWMVSSLAQYIGPQSWFGQRLISLGLSVSASNFAPYIIGLAIILTAVYVLGLLVETRIAPLFSTMVGSVIRRIPIVSSIYDLSNKLTSIIDTEGGSEIKSMSPVWCFFGGEPGAAVLALMPSAKPVLIGSDSYFGILVPSSPVPVGGALIYVPVAWVKPAEGGVEHLMSVYVSMGVTAPYSADAGSTLQKGNLT